MRRGGADPRVDGETAEEQEVVFQRGGDRARFDARSGRQKQEFIRLEAAPGSRTWVTDIGGTHSKTNHYMFSPAFLAAVGVAEGEKAVGVLHIGYPEEIPEPKPRTAAAMKTIVYE